MNCFWMICIMLLVCLFVLLVGCSDLKDFDWFNLDDEDLDELIFELIELLIDVVCGSVGELVFISNGNLLWVKGFGLVVGFNG